MGILSHDLGSLADSAAGTVAAIEEDSTIAR
jgi:hypothetical protein